MVPYPRPLEAIHQIEVTTFCNLRCKYCPYPKQVELRGQERLHMELGVFERALEWAVTLNGRWCPEIDPNGEEGWRFRHGQLPGSTMAELSLTGVGEGLLHPEFVRMVRMAREALPLAPLVFSTNGILLTDEMAERLAPYEPMVFVSLHRPERAAFAINAARKHGILAGWNPSPATSAFDWAGQVDWPVSAPRSPCEYLRAGWGVVLVDGRVTTCCLDAGAKGVVGDVRTGEVGVAEVAPFSLCSGCHMVP